MLAHLATTAGEAICPAPGGAEAKGHHGGAGIGVRGAAVVVPWEGAVEFFVSPAQAAQLREMAADWFADDRSPWGERLGYVVVRDESPIGWTRVIDRPASWPPGAVAVPADPAGPMFVTVGDNGNAGSLVWEKLS